MANPGRTHLRHQPHRISDLTTTQAVSPGNAPVTAQSTHRSSTVRNSATGAAAEVPTAEVVDAEILDVKPTARFSAERIGDPDAVIVLAVAEVFGQDVRAT